MGGHGRGHPPRPTNQAAPDSSLASCDPEIRARFDRLVGAAAVQLDGLLPTDTMRHLVHHPIDGKLTNLPR